MGKNKPAKHEEIDPVTRDKFVADHDFDGIRELANEPPYWLSLIFIVTVLFSYYYLAKYHIFKSGDLQEERYRKEMAKYNPELEEEQTLDLRPRESEAPLVALVDEASLSAGREVYKINCAVCHLDQGQGATGPNLTDEYWIHGGSYTDIVRIVTDGVPAKGMIAWKTTISKQQILEVSSYLLTLKGTNPPNPKAPQGELYQTGE
jgi:cytochrome c oxidase cbb3-type subunit 3